MPNSEQPSPSSQSKNLSPEQLALLQSEARSPFRGLRRFFYVAFAGSAFLGAFTFLAKVASGEDLGRSLPNLLLQVGVGSLMVWLLRRDQSRS